MIRLDTSTSGPSTSRRERFALSSLLYERRIYIYETYMSSKYKAVPLYDRISDSLESFSGHRCCQE